MLFRNGPNRRLILLYWITCFLLGISLIFGCAPKKIAYPKPKTHSKAYQVYGKTYKPLPQVSSAYVEEGIASWYGPDFHGRRTANGEVYNMYAYTAAHKILPFNTKVKVTNLDNGKQVIVRINDRGPFVKGRIIDLSYQAAKSLGMIGPGTARVRIETLATLAKSQIKGTFYVQVGAFAVKDNALILQKRLQRLGYKSRIVPAYVRNNPVWRVQVGPYFNLIQAETNYQKLGNIFKGSFLFTD